MFNEKLVAHLKELAAMSADKSVPAETYLSHQSTVAKILSSSYEDLVDVAYDHEDSDLVIEALELITIDRDPKCKVVLTDLMVAHPDEKVQSSAKRLLFNVTTLEVARTFQESKHATKN